MASEYTPNYNLDLYVSTDKPNLRDQYNAAMGKIDTQMKANADGVTNANANVTTMQSQVNQNKEDIADANESISSLETTVGQHTTQIGSLQTTVEQQGTKITSVETTANNALSKANVNASSISSIQSDVSGIDTEMDGLSASVSALQSDVSDVESSVGTLNGEVTGLNRYIQTVDSRVSNLSSADTIKTVSLYTNASGTKANFALSSAISGYDFIRVDFADSSRKYSKVVPVTAQATQSVEISRAVFSGENEFLLSSATLQFPRTGTNVTFNYSGQIHHVFNTSTVGYEGCDVGVTAVYGIKFENEIV